MGLLLAQTRPSVSAFPETTIGSACTSTFSRIARRLLTLRPAHSRGHQNRDRYPKASDISSPPCLLRLLPAGAVAGRGLHPLEKRRLVTAHVDSRPSLQPPQTARSRRKRPFLATATEPSGSTERDKTSVINTCKVPLTPGVCRLEKQHTFPLLLPSGSGGAQPLKPITRQGDDAVSEAYIQDSLAVGQTNRQEDQERAFSWLAERVNTFVNVLRPRMRSLAADYQQKEE